MKCRIACYRKDRKYYISPCELLTNFKLELKILVLVTFKLNVPVVIMAKVKKCEPLLIYSCTSLLRIHVNGGQRLVKLLSLSPHRRGPAKRDFQSSISVEVLVCWCHQSKSLLHQQFLHLVDQVVVHLGRPFAHC